MADNVSENSEVKTKEEAVNTSVPVRRRLLLGIGLPLWVVAGFLFAGFTAGAFLSLLEEVGVPVVDSVNPSVLNATVAALVYVLTLVIVIGVPLKLRNVRTTKDEMGMAKPLVWRDIALAPASFIVYLLLSGTLIAVVTNLFPGFDAQQSQEVGFGEISQRYEYILAFTTLVLVAPFAEEVLMRGYLYGKLRKILPLALAAIVTSALFAVLHGQWNVAIDTFALSIVMIALREMTGSIWAGTLLHMLKNGIAFYFLFVNPTLLNTIGG